MKSNHPFTLRNSIIFIVLAVGVIYIFIHFSRAAGRKKPEPEPDRSVPALAAKPAPKEITFHGCPPEGSGGDGALNLLKNRVDEGNFSTVTPEAILALSWPEAVERKRRDLWPATDKELVDQHEGVPVASEGYLLQVKEEEPESPNCKLDDIADKDFHLWLASSAGDDRSSAVVVEITPRIRVNHPEWTLASLRRIIREKKKVRISGWLLLDQEHPDQVGKTRGTLWEIHPIMKIETEQNGSFKIISDEE